MTGNEPSGVEPALPSHVDDTVQAIARLHALHAAEASPVQLRIERATRRVARPASVILLTVLVLAWAGSNLLLATIGQKPFDRPPFFVLQGLVGLAALYMTILILTTQRREDQLASLREQLTLELAILSEQKSAKIIALLEELRRDDPNITDRSDTHADELSKVADPTAVVDALRQTNPLAPE
jgi:uncharacterized membrane protein